MVGGQTDRYADRYEAQKCVANLWTEFSALNR